MLVYHQVGQTYMQAGQLLENKKCSDGSGVAGCRWQPQTLAKHDPACDHPKSLGTWLERSFKSDCSSKGRAPPHVAQLRLHRLASPQSFGSVFYASPRSRQFMSCCTITSLHDKMHVAAHK